MRISDWSSDVCSSDLCGVSHRHAGVYRLSSLRGELQVLQHERNGKAAFIAVVGRAFRANAGQRTRSEEHTSELQSLMRISYAVFCLKKKNKNKIIQHTKTDKQNITTQTNSTTYNNLIIKNATT